MNQVSSPRARRLRAPLLLTVWILLGFEALGGLVIFFARLANGTLPGESLHIYVGVATLAFYGGYQWSHWQRVRSMLGFDRLLGFLAAGSILATLVTGLMLGWAWWRHAQAGLAGEVPYAPWLSAAHNIASMLVAAFVAGHLGTVLQRDRRAAPTRD